MRKALVTLIAAGAVAISIPALAQEATPATEMPPVATEAVVVPQAMPPVATEAVVVPQAAPASEPAPETTVAVPPPAAPDPAVVPTPQAPAVTDPAAVPAAPAMQTYITPDVAPEAAPEPEPVAPPAPPPPPPPPPTDPVTISVLNAVERICKPLVHGGDLKALATPLGYKGKKDAYTYVVAKPFQVTILPQGSNKNVCMVEVDYAIDQAEPIVVGVHNWAMARGWTLYRNDVYTTDLKRHTRSWELAGQTETEALVLVALKKADGAPLNRASDRATVLYSVTPAAPPAQ